MLKSISQLCLILILFIVANCSPMADTKTHHFTGNTMGTTFSVKFIKNNQLDVAVNYDSLNADIEARLKTVNQQMSTYIRDSEITQFNCTKDTEWFPISKDFATVLDTSLAIAKLSGGALDITVGPIVNLWGFGNKTQERLVPTDDEISGALQSIGFQKLTVRQNPPAVKKANAEMICDLSATAKGFGVDKVADYLDSLNIQNYMVEIGGEVRANGENENRQAWKIGISSPKNGQNLQKIIQLKNMAMATSGDYVNYFEKDGKRYSHTIDPRTGKPITHTLASVTILHPNCLTADALATAINVMGPQKGYQFSMDNNLAVFMIVKEGEGFVEKFTPQFEAEALR